MNARWDPASVLRRAWSEFRLPELQRLVRETIRFLNTIESEQLLGRGLTELEAAFRENPIGVALEACCAELREECGMEDSELQRATHGALVRRYMEGNPRWTVTFREAFEKYRGLAGWTLELACRASSTEGVREAPTSAPSSPHPAPVFSSR